MGGFVASHSPSPEALANEDADDGTSADDGTRMRMLTLPVMMR